MRKPIAIAALCISAFGGTLQAQETTYPDTIIVLDVSNSMWGQIDGVAKISIAQDVISELTTDLQEPIQFGLMAYGHRRKTDCGDIELVLPVAPMDADAFGRAVRSLSPTGRTPLTAAVQQAAEQLNYTETSARVILISDGIESCEGDPVALASELAGNALDLTVHVIGFDLQDGVDQDGLRALAMQNHGLFLTPDTADQLKSNLDTMMDMGSAKMAPGLSAPETGSAGADIPVMLSGMLPEGAELVLVPFGASPRDALSTMQANGETAMLTAPAASGRYQILLLDSDGMVAASSGLTVQ